VIVVGSQSILGPFREDQLPADATMSVEIDILPMSDDYFETERLADLIEGVAGEFSPFEEFHGFSIDSVDLSTSALPTGWRGRLVKVQNANTAAPDGEPQYTGWCLDKEDLCVAKLCAFREKDQNFIAALLRSALRRVWRCEHFSWWMTSMLHISGDPFDAQLQLSQLKWVTSSAAGAAGLAENYAGLPIGF
jgi:hypothetical protein